MKKHNGKTCTYSSQKRNFFIKHILNISCMLGTVLGQRFKDEYNMILPSKECIVILKTKVVNNFSQFSSVAQSCPTLCDPMNHSTPGLPVCHQLPECTQTHVHRVSDAIQPSHPLSSPSPPAPNPSQHQSLFQ